MPGKQRVESSPSVKEKPRPKLPDLTAILDTEVDGGLKAGEGADRDAGGGVDPQVTAPVSGQVRSKMWKVKDFQKKTDEGLLTQAGTAQKKIAGMITTYLSEYSGGGAVSNKDLGKAVDLLLQMRASVNWWINDHTVDVDNGLGGVRTIEDPKRKKRMAGMKEFRTFVDSEIGALQAQQRKVGAEVTEEITEKHPGFLKLETRYDGNVRSMLAKVGEIADKAVPRNGDWIELELEFQVPCDPSGVGYLGGRLKASAFKEDDFVKVRAELAITGGASVDFATIGGEVGGYLEAQADTAAGAMTLMSYGMYRRFKESHALPEEMSNFLWGGNAGSYGKGKAEQWSLDVEKEYFDTDDPTRQESVYVETGAKAAVGADLDAEVFTASVGATASTGRRTDFASLKNRKGGAGKANKASDSVLAQGTRALTGGSRGAQKRTGRDVYGTSLSASMEVGLPGFGSIGWALDGFLGWASDGSSKTQTGVAPTTSLSRNELWLTTTAAFSLGALLGPAGSAMLEALAERVIALVRSDLTRSKEDQSAGGAIALHSTEAGMGLLGNALAAAGASALSAASDVQVVLFIAWDGLKKQLDFDIRKGHGTGIEVPSALSITMSRSSRVAKLTYKDGSWTLS